MINELYQLSVALSARDIEKENWYREYKPIPKIKANSPCVRIVFLDNQIHRLDSVDKELGEKLRKYGNNQGTFPAMNLAPLYRIVDVEQCAKLSKMLKTVGQATDILQLKQWCTCKNWGSKFKKKYRKSMEEIPARLEQILQREFAYEPVSRLIREVKLFAEPEVLHAELERAAFELLEKQINTALALRILFYAGRETMKPEDDYGSLSVIMDCEALEKDKVSSATVRFTRGLNQALLSADVAAKSTVKPEMQDAFGVMFAPLEEPMPTVKLAGGFETSLRTMFKGQPCQSRYGRFENATYPIAPELRSGMQAALAWISAAEMENKTWVSIGKDEILFAFPSRFPERMANFAGTFQQGRMGNQKFAFEDKAKAFSQYITEVKETDPKNYPDDIQIFILRKLDKARTKVIYTRCQSPAVIVRQSDQWQEAARNLPKLWIGDPLTPFPLHIASIMNRTWKQDGARVSDKFKAIPAYHGIELLFGVQKQTLENDLHFMMKRSVNMVLSAGKLIHSGAVHDRKWIPNLRESSVLIGMLLYWLNHRKEDYMKGFPYLLGQMLKISDSLHELYCYEVREGQVPPQLVGSSMYAAASEMPVQTLAQLGKRMLPYITWAKANRGACIKKKRKNGSNEDVEYFGPSAGYLLYIYKQTANKLMLSLEEKERFNDYEKAQVFIGYLASFPKKEEVDNDTQENKHGRK